MFFFGLSLGEFLALFSAASAVVFALYLLDRSRRKVAVPTLRFWNEARRPVESSSRRRIRQWPSLILQLVSIACLLLALSQLRLGNPETGSRDHVLILDTSSWMSARSGNATLMDQARASALQYLRAIPAHDRVLVMFADALATPVTSFETDRRKIERAIRTAQSGDAALDLKQALDYAARLQQRGSKRGGEIVFAGAARTSLVEGPFEPPPNLRLLTVKSSPENVGIRKIGLRHSTSEGGLWHIFVSVRNYGQRAQPVELALQFGGAPVGGRRLTVAAGAEQETAFEYRTRAAGPIEARVRAAGDTFPADDRALLELPAVPEVAVTVCSAEPKLLRPLIESHPNVRASYKTPTQCAAAPVREGLLVLDRVSPPWPVTTPSILIEPPAGVAKTVSGAALQKWNTAHPVGSGLQTQGLQLASTQVVPSSGGGVVVIGESSAGPVIVARDVSPRQVVFGFHPMKSPLRFELTTPLLFANSLRWMAPDGFRSWEVYAGSVGAVTVPVESEALGQNARVIGANAQSLPFTVQGKTLRFFSGKPGTVRVISGDREQVHSLTLPSVPDSAWEAPANVRRGVPRVQYLPSSWRDIWYWLALAGGLGLLLEWLLFSPAGRGLPRSLLQREQPATGEPLRRAS